MSRLGGAASVSSQISEVIQLFFLFIFSSNHTLMLIRKKNHRLDIIRFSFKSNPSIFCSSYGELSFKGHFIIRTFVSFSLHVTKMTKSIET